MHWNSEPELSLSLVIFTVSAIADSSLKKGPSHDIVNPTVSYCKSRGKNTLICSSKFRITQQTHASFLELPVVHGASSDSLWAILHSALLPPMADDAVKDLCTC